MEALYFFSRQVLTASRFLGVSHEPPGLLFAEACGGNLQTYLDQHAGMTSLALRLKWCSQSAEAIAFIHQKGVIHSDLRLDCFLLQFNDLLLCDFGGSSTASGSIDGGHLPDSGFFNPNKPWVSTKETDIFSLGSIFYTIMTDHWPYRSPGPFTSVQEKELYANKVDELFSLNKYPSTDDLVGGYVIQQCWEGQYERVEDILHDQASLFRPISH
jgi:serine/threonine protein kinase